MFKLANLLATNEDLSSSGALGATEDALKAQETATEVADGNVEVIENAGEIDNLNTGIEDAFEASDRVEELLGAAEETMQQGGMSEKEAELLEISHESILSSLGMGHRTTTHTSNPVPSLESFGSEVSRGSATLVTVESLKDTGKTIISKIVAALKAAWNTVSNFIAGLLRNRAVMARHLDNLEAKVKAIPADAKPAKDSFKTAAAALSVAGKADVSTAKKILMTAKGLVNASITISGAFGAAADSKGAVTTIKAAVQRLPKRGSDFGDLTHGRTIAVKTEDDYVTLEVKDSGAKAESIEAPSKAQMLDLISDAKARLTELRAAEKLAPGFKDVVEKITKRLSEVKDQVRSKVGSDESKAEHSASAEAKKNARLAQAMMSKAGGTFPGAAYQAVKAVADYVTAGVNNHKAEAKAEDKK